jgi:hypothetical protein
VAAADPDCGMFADEIESIKSMFDSFVAVSDRDKQRALELVLQSRTFVRSEQLRAFLRYVCSMEIEGRGEQITEYRIAVEALGRSQDYTTTEDSAVRNRAHALRVKLEELYTKELSDAPIRIDFFKGSYRPHFVVQNSPAKNGSVAPVITPAETAKPQTAAPKLRVLGLVVAGLALAAFLAGLWLRGFVKHTPDSLVAEAWGPSPKRRRRPWCLLPAIVTCRSGPDTLDLQSLSVPWMLRLPYMSGTGGIIP